MKNYNRSAAPCRDVIFVSNALADGGAARVLCLLADQFARWGHCVEVLSFRPCDGEYSLRREVTKSYCPDNRNSPTAKLRRIFWIRKQLKSHPDATVIAFEYFVNMQVLIACIGLSNRVIVSERNDPARVGSAPRTAFLRRYLYRRAFALVCQTNEAAAYFSEAISKTVILNPLNPDLPLPIETGRRKTIVTFCRLEEQKNLGMLIRAFAEFHQTHTSYTLEIHGNGSQRGALVALRDSLGLNDSVRILPARSDIHNVVRDCAMFVLPSDYEGLSNSMIEAMALGVPTICTDCPCGGARMIIENGKNGLLVPVGDTTALVAAISKLADDPCLAYRISQAGMLIRSRLSIDQISAEWAQLAIGRPRG